MPLNKNNNIIFLFLTSIMAFLAFVITPYEISAKLSNEVNIHYISQVIDLHGSWIAEWDANLYILKDKIFIKQTNDKLIAEYDEQPSYPNCDGSQILPNSLYFEGIITSDNKIIGESWACQNENQKTTIPLELEIQEGGNKLVGVWKDTKGVENSFVFTKDSASNTKN